MHILLQLRKKESGRIDLGLYGPQNVKTVYRQDPLPQSLSWNEFQPLLIMCL